ncbi:hypothetical protein [Desulfovibrio sp. SGI.169]|uniref:hypothetical protein n=1 Tax=Desulfovibrio sp. SGI.169 TaxID=3420561 RepID=UPI003D088FB9
MAQGKYDEANRHELATRGDAQNVRIEIKKVREELKTDIKKVKAEIQTTELRLLK